MGDRVANVKEGVEYGSWCKVYGMIEDKQAEIEEAKRVLIEEANEELSDQGLKVSDDIEWIIRQLYISSNEDFFLSDDPFHGGEACITVGWKGCLTDG